MTSRKKEEEILQDSIIALAKLLGYLHYHTHDSRRSAKGFPDLVLVHPRTGRLIFIECKAKKGSLSEEQRGWGSSLLEVKGNIGYFIIRPTQWADGTVESILKGGAKRKERDKIREIP